VHHRLLLLGDDLVIILRHANVAQISQPLDHAIDDATAIRADRTTLAVATAQAALDDAKKARDRESYRTDGSLAKGPSAKSARIRSTRGKRRSTRPRMR
jgi:hypothetical protein